MHKENQFSSFQSGSYALGKAHMRSTPSLRSFPNVAFETVPTFIWLQWPSLVLFYGRSSSASCFHAFLLQAIDGVMSLAFCRQVVSQTPEHFRSSEKQATCEGCFVHQSICSVISFQYSMSNTVHTQEFSTVDVDHWHIPVWAYNADARSNFTSQPTKDHIGTEVTMAKTLWPCDNAIGLLPCWNVNRYCTNETASKKTAKIIVNDVKPKPKMGLHGYYWRVAMKTWHPHPHPPKKRAPTPSTTTTTTIIIIIIKYCCNSFLPFTQTTVTLYFQVALSTY